MCLEDINKTNCIYTHLTQLLCLQDINKTNRICTHLTQLYNILLLFYYWLLVSASLSITSPIFANKNLKMLVHIVQKVKFMGSYLHSLISFTIITSFYMCSL
jgi:hypothetical protein